MKKSIQPILLAISTLIISASFAGCADSEQAANNSIVNTDETNGSSNVSEESNISSFTTTTNPYDTSKPIDTTTPPVSSSSSSSTNSESSNSSTNSEPKNSDTNSSSNSKPSVIKIPDGAQGEYFDVNGNPMPSNFDPSKGGYYNRNGCYVMPPAELAEYNRQAQEIANNPDSYWRQTDPDDFFRAAEG